MEKELLKFIEELYKEFWYDIDNIETEEVISLKNYIDYVINILNDKIMVYNEDTHIINIFIKKHKDYLEEAFASLIIGNYNGFNASLRMIIENYVSFYIIKKNPKKKLEDKWYYWSILKEIEKLKDTKVYEKIKKETGETFSKNSIDVKNINTKNYGWLDGILPKKDLNFKKISSLVDKSIYNDYKKASEIVHNDTYISKLNIVLMEQLGAYIFNLYYYTDLFIKILDKEAYNSHEYNKLKKDLLKKINKCINI